MARCRRRHYERGAGAERFGGSRLLLLGKRHFPTRGLQNSMMPDVVHPRVGLDY